MAAEQGYVGRVVGQLINWLAVPRAFSWPVLLLAGMGCGHLLWLQIDNVKILSWVSGMVTPFCMVCATAVWAMRDRIDDAFDVDHMSAQEYEKAVTLGNQHRRRSTFWAGTSAFMALLSSMPAVSNQLIGPVWHWMLLALGGAVGTSVYAYQLANHWEQQIRAYKSKQRLQLKTKQEKQDLLDALRSSSGPNFGPGWVQGPALKVSSDIHH
jgi:hypothetical protein